MKRCLLAPCLLLGSLSFAEPAPLSADLQVLHDGKQWPVRSTFLGWTADSKAVYRSLVCDQDVGGERGPWCKLELCVGKPYPDDEAKSFATAQAECTSLLTLDLNTDDRSTVKDAELSKASATALAALGPLEPGSKLANSSVKLVDRKQVVTLSRAVKGADAKTSAVFAYQKSVDGAPQTTREHKVTEVWISPEGRCTVALGRFTFVSRWEGQPTSRPMPFAKVVCD